MIEGEFANSWWFTFLLLKRGFNLINSIDGIIKIEFKFLVMTDFFSPNLISGHRTDIGKLLYRLVYRYRLSKMWLYRTFNVLPQRLMSDSFVWSIMMRRRKTELINKKMIFTITISFSAGVVQEHIEPLPFYGSPWRLVYTPDDSERLQFLLCRFPNVESLRW